MTNRIDPSKAPVYEIAVNLDDVDPQVLGDAQQQLLDAGALDVWTTAIGMKKQRPGVMLSLLTAEADRDRLARLVLALTGSFGLRMRPWDRLVLDREHVQLTCHYGQFRAKLGRLDGELVAATPEFEDVRFMADAAGVTVRQAMAEANRAIADQLDAQG